MVIQYQEHSRSFYDTDNVNVLKVKNILFQIKKKKIGDGIEDYVFAFNLKQWKV